jgi:large subunit ribosomal protein L29
MELAKIRNLSDAELKHQEKADGEQLFRLRFQVAMGQNDGVKKLRQLRKEIAQLKTVVRERELGIRGESKEKPAAVVEVEAAAQPAAKPKAKKAAVKAEPAAPRAKNPVAAKTKTEKAKGASK